MSFNELWFPIPSLLYFTVSGVSSINAHKNIFMNLHKYESRLMSWVQGHEIQLP